ncbi:unnamed protein product [Amoebophrya sp. A25]|nr:unnamed protein product [Amoebophrya sp. A25]|eukprot:GSA25T00016569001.1
MHKQCCDATHPDCSVLGDPTHVGADANTVRIHVNDNMCAAVRGQWGGLLENAKDRSATTTSSLAAVDGECMNGDVTCKPCACGAGSETPGSSDSRVYHEAFCPQFQLGGSRVRGNSSAAAAAGGGGENTSGDHPLHSSPNSSVSLDQYHEGSKAGGRTFAAPAQHCVRVQNTFVHIDCAQEDCDLCAIKRRANSCHLDELQVARIMEGFHWCDTDDEKDRENTDTKSEGGVPAY